MSEHQNFELFFQSAYKIPKISRITIVMSLIMNIALLFRLYIIVVAKSWFEWLSGMGGCEVNPSNRVTNQSPNV